MVSLSNHAPFDKLRVTRLFIRVTKESVMVPPSVMMFPVVMVSLSNHAPFDALRMTLLVEP